MDLVEVPKWIADKHVFGTRTCKADIAQLTDVHAFCKTCAYVVEV